MQNRAALRQSDAEITRPLNEAPDEPPAWHVHMELRPEELVVLHRLGFTGGALAWREGMREWQPLRIGESSYNERDSLGLSALDDERGRAAPSSERRPDFDSSRRPTVFSHGPHSAPPMAQPMPVPLVRLRTQPEMLPPPPPLELRTSYNEIAEQSGAVRRQDLHRGELSPGLMGGVQELKPSSIPPGVVLEPVPRPLRRSPASKAMWLGAAALVALSASNGALVSALLWSLKHDGRASALAAKLTGSTASLSSPSAACPIPAPKTASPSSTPTLSVLGTMPVSIEQLPLAGSEADSSSSKSSSSRASRRHSAPHRASSSARKVAASAAEDATPPLARAIDAAVAPAEIASNGPPDRRAIAQAVSRASGAATSCGESPQNGRVSMTFSPSGNVQSVQLVQAFGETSVNSCVLRAMGRARVSAFTGDAITVQKTLSW